MKQSIEAARKLIAVEIKLGFLYVPAQVAREFPSEGTTRVPVTLAGSTGGQTLAYNSRHRRLFGLTKWYRDHKVSPGDQVAIRLGPNGDIALSFSDSSPTTKTVVDEALTAEEAEELLDLSGLSGTEKGKLVENRVEELLLLYGQGQLTVFHPSTDTEGIDLVVMKKGVYQPLYLQIKARYKPPEKGRHMVWDIRMATHRPHGAYYIVCAYFDPVKLELHDNLLLVPSKRIAELAQVINAKGDKRYRIGAQISPTQKSKYHGYLCPKVKLAERLLEHIDMLS